MKYSFIASGEESGGMEEETGRDERRGSGTEWERRGSEDARNQKARGESED